MGAPSARRSETPPPLPFSRLLVLMHLRPWKMWISDHVLALLTRNSLKLLIPASAAGSHRCPGTTIPSMQRPLAQA